MAEQEFSLKSEFKRMARGENQKRSISHKRTSMKTRLLLTAMALLAAGTCLSRADITGINLWGYNTSVMTCDVGSFVTNSPGNYLQNIDGSQLAWAPGTIKGTILTDGLDPTLQLGEQINNDTLYAWDDYHVTITMSQSFSFSNVSVANAGWTYLITNPTWSGSNYVGQVDYYAGTPVPADNSVLDFSLGITFSGNASFQEDLMPSSNSVPEPTTAGCFLLGLGALACCQRFNQSRRSR